jgi:hypothetical protein
MSDVLKTAQEWLQAKLKAHASRAVTYRRGSQSVTLSAWVGSSVLKVASGEYGEMQIERTDRDYLLAAADLVLGGSVVQPAPGDRIEDALDGRAYEVLAPRGEPVWRYSDNRRTTLRIHTKDVGAL